MKKRVLLSIACFLCLQFGLVAALFLFGEKITVFNRLLNVFPNIIRFLLLILIQEIIIITFVLVSYKFLKSEKTYFKDIKSQFVKPKVLKLIGYSVGLWFCYAFFVAGLHWIFNYFNVSIPGFFGEQDVVGLIGNLPMNNGFDIAVIFVSVCIIGPLVEEFVYRGFVTRQLLDNFDSRLAIVLSALIFDLVHMEWAVFGDLFIVSLLISWIYYKTNSLTYSFAFHFVFNFVSFLALVFMKFAI